MLIWETVEINVCEYLDDQERLENLESDVIVKSTLNSTQKSIETFNQVYESNSFSLWIYRNFDKL